MKHNNIFYIVTQNRESFLETKKYLHIKWDDFSRIKKESINNNIIIFLYDYNAQKIYGEYKTNIENIEDKPLRKKFISVELGKPNKRRGVYFNSKDYLKDFSMYRIDADFYDKIILKLDILNNPMPQSFFDINITNNTFKYKYIETYTSLYVGEYSKSFNLEAYKSIYDEYKRLISIAGSENIFLDKYLDIGNALMNMFIPESDFRSHILNSVRLIYLSLNKNTLDIPWQAFALDNNFISNKIIFSYTYAKNIVYNTKPIKNKSKMAIIFIPSADMPNAQLEINMIESIGNMEKDIYIKEFTYFEIINIFENYDIVHIITHGNHDGIFIGKNSMLQSIDKLRNPPLAVFLSACNMDSDNNKLIESIMDSGVRTVIGGVSTLSDSLYLSFIKCFYENLLSEHSRVNTASAYYFAYNECKNGVFAFLRFKFHGVPTYI